MRGHNPVGKLRAALEQRERGAPYRGAQFSYVAAIRDDLGDVWTCEARKPRDAHQHPEAKFALSCAEKALADGTWKDDLPPAPVS